MSIRIRIAKWLAPELVKDADFLMAVANRRLDDSLRQWTALRSIAAQRTPGANATVKRMADIADQALKTGEA